VNRAVGREQRQRDIVGDAFGPHVVEKRKALACRIVDKLPDLAVFVEHNPQRAVLKFRRIQETIICGAVGDLGARLPDEINAENIGMQGAHENADTPQRQAGRYQPFAEFRHHLGRA